MLSVKAISKTFKNGQELNKLFSSLSFNVNAGSWTTIIGPSGTGKSTLLHCISGLQSLDEGTVEIDNIQVHTLKEAERSDFRRKKIGFIFQDYKLLPHYHVLDNVLLPLYRDREKKRLKEKAVGLLNKWE
ncbi:putative ABC transport system ATP-binding protein/lipoprotein-releasing system ATP-binding protein [Evansella caseinilytica]|uniref:Putative ABC transport system ATP-binding protein/lipoprotein-releasing system ATP-binding protein n=1 Tax=Evansella caseinilytica TaxID=1503961 RepID=A0A1H3UX27_9BACI|nr:ATP-binding cassette domain-containing protein [Evansella caseinilytica]SDZ66907.1 putative ABC transport system ATP-binding protein/lipoprotein-releasing system ATP-binding protein [Evansella caseinilytica]